MQIVDAKLLNNLSAQAQASKRRRQHYNLHTSYDEACQKILNAIEPNSYIRPHRHSIDPKAELLSLLRGAFLVILFDDNGRVTETVKLAVGGIDCVVAIELLPTTWHTVVSLQPGSVLLEVKAGPFNPEESKEFASWAPVEGDLGSESYLGELIKKLVLE